MVADVSPYVTAGVGLLGSLIGSSIAAVVTLMVARQAREAAASSWIRTPGARYTTAFFPRARSC